MSCVQVDAAAASSVSNPQLDTRPAAGAAGTADVGAVLAAAVVVSRSQLVCEVPAWGAPAAVVGFYVSRAG
jgi:hypothetical protein